MSLIKIQKKYSFSFIIFIGIVLSFFNTEAVQADGSKSFYITSGNIVTVPSEEGIKIVEVLEFQNSENKQELELYAPDGAEDLNVFDGLDLDNVTIKNNKITYKGDLPEGSFKVTFGYFLRYESNSTIQIEYNQLYWAGKYRVTIPSGKLTVTGDKFLPQSESIEMNGVRFRRFLRLDYHPDTPWNLIFQKPAFKVVYEDDEGHDEEEVEITEDGLPIIGHVHGAKPKEAVMNIILVIGILVLGIISIRYTYGKKNTKNKKYANIFSEREQLLDEVVELERQKANGDLSDSEFTKQSSEKLMRLKEIATRFKGDKA